MPCQECLEQARLLGMSGERETKLLSEIDALRCVEITRLNDDVTRLDHEVNVLKAKLSVAREALERISWYVAVGISREGSRESVVRIDGEVKEALVEIGEEK